MEHENYHLGIKALILNDKGEVLLFKVNPEALKKKVDPYWDIPGGRVEKGENPIDTLFREIKEEAGLEKENFEKVESFSMVLSNIRIPLGDNSVGLILWVHKCHAKSDLDIKLSFEHLEYGWFEKDEASKLLEYKYPIEFTRKIRKLKY